MMDIYKVWRIHNQQYADFLPCREIIKARSQKEADYKLARRFSKAGFHLMALVAIPIERDPNRAQ
jgi:hypothetical protein